MSYQDALITLATLITIGSLFYIHHNRHKNLESMGLGAIGLELLGVVLSVYWAVTVMQSKFLALFFVLAWVAMVAIRAAALPTLIDNMKGGLIARSLIGFFVLTIAYIALYSTGLFHALNDSGDAAQARLESSTPAIALDANIAATQARIDRLAGFSNADKAHAETVAATQSKSDNAAKIQSVHEQLAALTMPTFPSRFERYMNQDCTPKTDNNGLHYRTKAKQLCREWQRITAGYEKQKRVLNAQLPRGATDGAGTSYADKYTEYEGLQTHLTQLKNERAALSASGQGVQEAWRPEDRAIAWLFGVTAENASRIKWLLFVAVFDVLAMLVRINVAMNSTVQTNDEIQKSKMLTLLKNGFSADEAVAALGLQNHAIPNATTSPNQLREGGHVLSDGLIHAHAKEAVLNQGATDEIGRGEIDRLNAKHRGGNQPTAPQTIYKGYERVPSQLSKKAGKGRTGKIDTCKDCSDDFIVRTYNACRCKKCADTAQNSYSTSRLG